MAGGTGWYLESKEDGYDTRQMVVDGEETRHFRAKKVVFVIYRQIKSDNINLAPGDLGEVSGTLSVAIGRATKSRISSRAKFLCTSDRTDKEPGPGKWVIWRQTWEALEREEEYDPETGEAIT